MIFAMIKSLLTTMLLLTSLSAYAQQNVADSLRHQSYQRRYIVHLPPDFTGNTPLPVVLVLHGGSGNYLSVQGFTRMNPISDQNDFLAVYPQGRGIAPPGFSWADGRGTTADNANIDDVGFMTKLIDSLHHDYNIDTNRVYVCGFSNGGFMTQRLACEIPDQFAAIGALGCSMDTNLIQRCQPDRAVPMAYFSGTADPEVPYEGGAMRNPAVTPIVPVDTAVHFWVNANNCQTAEPVVDVPNTVSSDNSTVKLFQYTDCDCEANVYFYKIINGGHTWPGVPIPQFPQLGNTNEDIRASEELWEFFDQFSLCTLPTGTDDRFDAPRGMRVFPNPTRGTLRIASERPIKKVCLFNGIGLRVGTYNKATITLKKLPAGIYFLHVQLVDGSIKTIKVVKE